MLERLVNPPSLPDWIERDYPFERRAAVVSGRRIHFVDHGDGPTVLLVHGNPTWSYLWRKVMKRLLAAGFRVVAPDLMGLGLSEKPLSLGAHTLERHIGMISSLVDGLGLEDLVVVGQDWGGPISAGVAMWHAPRVRGLVFGNTAVVKPREQIGTTPFHTFSRMPVISDLVFRGLAFPVPAMSSTQGDPTSIGPKQTAAYFWPLRAPWSRAAPLALARMVPNSRSHPSIPLLDAIGEWVEAFEGPVELVWGTKDPILGRLLRRHKRRLPDARVTETPAGHFLQEEVPNELTDAIIRVATGDD
ncbi:MAG: alpha/beta fold hydrolase [Myxococcota bacterium]